MNRYVALLRGVNVGGKSLISMTNLKTCFEKAGLTEVATYINSGNILFSSTEADKRKLEELIEEKINQQFGFKPRAVVLSQTEMKDVVKNIPESWTTNTDQKFNVIFLSHHIDSPDITTGLNPKEGIETLKYMSSVLYWSANTSDLTKSSMLQLSRNQNYKEMTVRNLNTVRKLSELIA